MSSFWIDAPREGFTQLASSQQFSQARVAIPFVSGDVN